MMWILQNKGKTGRCASHKHYYDSFLFNALTFPNVEARSHVMKLLMRLRLPWMEIKIMAHYRRHVTPSLGEISLEKSTLPHRRHRGKSTNL